MANTIGCIAPVESSDSMGWIVIMITRVFNTNLSDLKEIISKCKCAGYHDAAKCFNEIGGRMLGHSFCDFTYKCLQVIDELEQNTGNTRFAEELCTLIEV